MDALIDISVASASERLVLRTYSSQEPGELLTRQVQAK